MADKLFRVDLHYITYVMAEDLADAKKVAEAAMPDPNLPLNVKLAKPAEHVQDVPVYWLNRVPYGGRKPVMEVLCEPKD